MTFAANQPSRTTEAATAAASPAIPLGDLPAPAPLANTAMQVEPVPTVELAVPATATMASVPVPSPTPPPPSYASMVSGLAAGGQSAKIRAGIQLPSNDDMETLMRLAMDDSDAGFAEFYSTMQAVRPTKPRKSDAIVWIATGKALAKVPSGRILESIVNDNINDPDVGPLIPNFVQANRAGHLNLVIYVTDNATKEAMYGKVISIMGTKYPVMSRAKEGSNLDLKFYIDIGPVRPNIDEEKLLHQLRRLKTRPLLLTRTSSAGVGLVNHVMRVYFAGASVPDALVDRYGTLSKLTFERTTYWVYPKSGARQQGMPDMTVNLDIFVPPFSPDATPPPTKKQKSHQPETAQDNWTNQSPPTAAAEQGPVPPTRAPVPQQPSPPTSLPPAPVAERPVENPFRVVKGRSKVRPEPIKAFSQSTGFYAALRDSVDLEVRTWDIPSNPPASIYVPCLSTPCAIIPASTAEFTTRYKLHGDQLDVERISLATIAEFVSSAHDAACSEAQQYPSLPQSVVSLTSADLVAKVRACDADAIWHQAQHHPFATHHQLLLLMEQQPVAFDELVLIHTYKRWVAAEQASSNTLTPFAKWFVQIFAADPSLQLLQSQIRISDFMAHLPVTSPVGDTLAVELALAAFELLLAVQAPHIYRSDAVLVCLANVFVGAMPSFQGQRMLAADTLFGLMQCSLGSAIISAMSARFAGPVATTLQLLNSMGQIREPNTHCVLTATGPTFRTLLC